MSAHVLSVGADHEVRAMIADVPRAAGHHWVECVYTGTDALHALNEQQANFDLIVGELTMPAMQGAPLPGNRLHGGRTSWLG